MPEHRFRGLTRNEKARKDLDYANCRADGLYGACTPPICLRVAAVRERHLINPDCLLHERCYVT
jgi:hypothetical protein